MLNAIAFFLVLGFLSVLRSPPSVQLLLAF